MSMDAKDKAGFLLDAWKQSVDVQQHFNDICWRIRGLALTALTFSLGGAALAARDSVKLGSLQLSMLIALGGLVLWSGFAYLDTRYYHRLLKGSTEQTTALEKALANLGLPELGLASAITKSSATAPLRVDLYRSNKARIRRLFRRSVQTPGPFREVRSSTKLRNFYGVVMALLILSAALLQSAGEVQRKPDAQQEVLLILTTPTPSPNPRATTSPTPQSAPSRPTASPTPTVTGSP